MILIITVPIGGITLSRHYCTHLPRSLSLMILVAYASVSEMTRHRGGAQLQKLGFKLIGPLCTRGTSLAQTSSKELNGSGANRMVIEALCTHASDRNFVEQGVGAIRGLLLGCILHGKSVKLGMQVDADFGLHVGRVVKHVADAI